MRLRYRFYYKIPSLARNIQTRAVHLKLNSVIFIVFNLKLKLIFNNNYFGIYPFYFRIYEFDIDFFYNFFFLSAYWFLTYFHYPSDIFKKIREKENEYIRKVKYNFEI